MNPATALLLLLATALHPSESVFVASPLSLLEIQEDGEWARSLVPGREWSIGQGDRHPSLFGSIAIDSNIQWQSHISSEVLADTVRGVLREHLLNDPEYGVGGYGTDLAQISGSHYRTGQLRHSESLSSFGGFDLGLDDPLLDSSLIGASIDLQSTDLRDPDRYGQVMPTPDEAYRPYLEVLPWTRFDWAREDTSRNSNLGGIRATVGLDTLSPFRCHCLRFLLTANLEIGGESGVLFQICWQGNTRSP
ncbi:MAG: hypothetical protein OSB12_05910 [Planctomycetota bacterium]|jgi:hypothetical protein|nr:hypothetical protein [Planctomycetota bacterium]